MKNSSVLETISGICVVAFVIAIMYIFSSHSHGEWIKHDNSYVLHASFNNIDGVIVGSDIKISGIKIGEVSNIKLENYRATIALNIIKKYKIPDDSEAEIVTSGIIGDKYINIIPGISDSNFNQNEQISRTRSAINLENIITKFFNKNSDI